MTRLSEATLQRLSQAENFRSWDFGGIEKALEGLREQAEYATRHQVVIPEGEQSWDGEPDKVQWIDPTTGYDCLIVRNAMGALCGYVGVPPGHPLHGKDYGTCLQQPCREREDQWHCDHTAESILSVHGGVTFSDFCDPSESDETICHVPAEGRPDKVYWFGFDCAHAWDLVPGGLRFVSDHESVYRDITYVVGQIDALALQLKALE